MKTLSYLINAAVNLIVISLTSASAQSPKPKMGTYIPPEVTTTEAAEMRPAADALSNLGWATAYANDIARLLKSDNPAVRSSAAEALGELGSAAAPYANDIAQLLKSDDLTVRSSAADALGKLGPTAAPYGKDITELLKSNKR
jgi:HEAT repeat protein